MFGEFNGMLYVAIISDDWDADSEIWRSPNGDAGTWEKVFSVKNGGFGAALTSFKGYAYISGWDNEAGTAWVWRTPDGLRWEKVGAGVLDVQGNYSDDTIRQFRDRLYVSTHNIYGARIYRSDDGVEWEEVVNDGFGEESLFTEMNGLMPFQGDLYAFVTAYDFETGMSYARVYRSHTGDPRDWQPVLTDWGPYSGTNREEQAIFKGNLYAADFNFNNSPAVFRLSGN